MSLFHFHFLFFFLHHHHPEATSHSVVRGTLRGQHVQATLQVAMTRGRWSRGVGLGGASPPTGGIGLVGDVLRDPVLDLGPIVQVGQFLSLRRVYHGVVFGGARTTTPKSGS